MTPGFDPLTLILLAAAAIVIWRLRAVLGQRTGLERPPFDPTAQMPKPAPARPQGKLGPRDIEGTAVEVKPESPVWEGHAPAGSPVAKGLEAIAGKARDFNVPSFTTGATLAYEMIVEAFAKGDKTALKPLLARDVYDSFVSEIDARTKAGRKMKFQFVGMKSATLQQATLKGNIATIVVRFLSETISATLDAAGAVVSGDPKTIQDLSDVWTFERDVTSRDPNWKLVATQDNA